MRPIVIESPYAGDVERNLRYLRAAMADAIQRGETPYASHALLTQPGVLRDDVPEERALGIKAGFRMGEVIAAVGGVRAFYVDLGWSSGMKAGLAEAERIGQPVEMRSVPGWTAEAA